MYLKMIFLDGYMENVTLSSAGGNLGHEADVIMSYVLYPGVSLHFFGQKLVISAVIGAR
jgi:hypothetical protein